MLNFGNYNCRWSGNIIIAQQIERNVAANTEVWVVTSSILFEKNYLKPVILKNITEKGILYKYVIPDDNPDSIDIGLVKLFIKGITDKLKKDAKLLERFNYDETKIKDEIIKRLNGALQIYTVPSHYSYMTALVYNYRPEDVDEKSLSENEKQQILVKLPEVDVNKPRNLSFRVPDIGHPVFISSINTFLGLTSDCKYRKKLNLSEIINNNEIRIWSA